MAADVFFYTKAKFRFRLIYETDNSASSRFKDWDNSAKLETNAWRVFEH